MSFRSTIYSISNISVHELIERNERLTVLECLEKLGVRFGCVQTLTS